MPPAGLLPRLAPPPTPHMLPPLCSGALDLTHKVAYLGMTPLAKVVMLSSDDKLDRATLRMLLESGHSRIPVYQGTR